MLSLGLGLQRGTAFDLINITTLNVQIFRCADPCKDNLIPEFLLVMTKQDAVVEEAFYENKNKQESKDLEIQRLNFVLLSIYGPGKRFYVPINCFLQGLFGERV